jgi:large subunit ribosomal protein L19
VERIFTLCSPWIETIEVKAHNIVRRSKLYYLRDRAGRSARLREERSRK